MEHYLDDLLRRAEMVREWRKYVVKVAQAVLALLPDADVYVFGSVVRGQAVGGSDVDVLIVSEHIPESNIERARLKLKIEETAALPSLHPFEMHLADKKEAEWYFSRIKEMVKVKA